MIIIKDDDDFRDYQRLNFNIINVYYYELIKIKWIFTAVIIQRMSNFLLKNNCDEIS